MPQQPMEITPVMGGANEDTVLDFNVSTNGRPYQTSESEFVYDSMGERHHVFEDVTLDEDDISTDVNIDIINGIHYEYPSLTSAVAWATESGYFSEEQAIAWNNALDLNPQDGFGAVDTLHRMAQELTEAYEEAGGQYEETEELEDFDEDEEHSFTQEEFDTYQQLEDGGHVDAYIETLLDDYSFGYEQIDYMESMLDSGNCSEIESDMLSLGVAVAEGNLTMEDAIEAFTDAYGDVRAVNQFFLTQQHFN